MSIITAVEEVNKKEAGPEQVISERLLLCSRCLTVRTNGVGGMKLVVCKMRKERGRSLGGTTDIKYPRRLHFQYSQSNEWELQFIPLRRY